MKFDILNRWDGSVIVTADIDTDSEDKSIQLGLAVRWAVKNKANLSDANLSDADLSDADLWNADMRNANLSDATLWNADLRNANLSDADLRNADLSDADLMNADMRNANLWNANLMNADLRNASGNMKHIKTMQIDGWPISYTATVMQIGCQRYPIEKWRKFQDKTIDRMDSSALAWWKVWKPIIFQIIEASPAEPTKDEQ